MNVSLPFYFSMHFSVAFSKGTKEKFTCFAITGLWHDGVIQVEETKNVMGLELTDASLFWRPIIPFLKQRWIPTGNSQNVAKLMFEIV